MRDETTCSGYRPAGALATLIALELSAVAALHLLGRRGGLTIDWRHLWPWLTSGGAEDVLAASLRLVALACAYWLLLSTVLYVAARLADLPAAVRAVEWATLTALSRLADRALAVALVGSTVTGSAGVAWASTAPFAGPLVVLGAEDATSPIGVQLPPPPTLETPSPQPFDDQSGFDPLPDATPSPDVVPPPVPARPPAPRVPIPPSAQPSHETCPACGLESPRPPGLRPFPGQAKTALPPETCPDGIRGRHGASREGTVARAEMTGQPVEEVHAVVQGENLWRIAVSTLRRRQGDEPRNHEVVAYWRVVIEANRHRLRSGNPNLIFPGEQVVLPCHEHKPERSAGP